MSQVPTGGKWLKAKELQVGDKAVIVTEADWVKGEYNGQETNQYICEVEYNGERRKMKMTMASCEELSPAYGKDSKEWIGKEISLEAIKVMVGGNLKQTILATPVNGVTSSKPNLDADGNEIQWDD